MTVLYDTRPVEERFWLKVRKTDTCWLWTASTVNGYGQIATPRFSIRTAHRLAWHIMRGPIPPGMSVLHRCDVRACVNPDHLFLGTTLDNNRDAVAKGRNAHGEKSSSSKLTAQAVRNLAEMRSTGLLIADLSKHFNVTTGAIIHILNGRSWASVDIDWAKVKEEFNKNRKPRAGRTPPKTHCKLGHEMVLTSKRRTSNWRRVYCRECTLARARKNYRLRLERIGK